MVINIEGMDNQSYLSAEIVIVGFDYTAVAADSNSKTGAFLESLQYERDIGKPRSSFWFKNFLGFIVMGSGTSY